MVVILCSLLLVLTDIIFIRWIGLEPNFPRPFWPQFFQVSIICLILKSSFSQKAFFIWLRIFLTFSFLQWLCLSYYGTYLTPMMFFLFFKEFHEVLESSRGALSIVVKPMAWYITSLLMLKKIQKKESASVGPFIQSPFKLNLLRCLVFISLFYPIPRTFVTGHTFGKQAKVQEVSFINFYGTLSYFFGRVAPVKIGRIWKGLGNDQGQQALIKKTEASQNFEIDLTEKDIIEKHPQRHIVFILGESLGLRHLQLFGYNQPTTPKLKSWMDKKWLFLRKGVSGGVSTDVSIPMLIHSTSGNEAATAVATQNRCLFKLAKQNGFITSFISVQTQENLQHISNYFCNSYLDLYRVGDNSKTINGESAILDEELKKEIQSLNWNLPQFTILHQRGSHSPYEMRYPKDQALIKIEDSDPRELQQRKHYDNSVYYTDQILTEIIDWIKNHSKLPVEIVFTSDHGEALGEDQQWGHVILFPVVAEVPVMYFPSDEKFKFLFETQGEWVSHRFVSLFLMKLLGYNIKEFPVESEFNVMGADLDGLDGSMKLRAGNGELVRIQN